ncbi:type II secretion system protein GspE [Nocardioides sp. MAH-18]|uniref:Type II secretion system protein GspE n=1 Tax=Nocardioides agri TaxID=2682843 RepID=A0A6L6XUW9_9ACTN|nr:MULTISPECIES: GspE/PulE family protein [unclassified Nocardioides]MBA2954494.1 type II/IV secretion system protein [Nocardioides sp. CGMCC 1.13656]MVQ49355.1 type II secretion system protein GspE [Nocardioides sp. MAH-18]
MTQTNQGATVEALLALDEVTPADVERARARAESEHRSVLDVLIADGVVDRRALLRMAALAAGLDHVDLTDHPVDAGAAALVPGEFARRASALPYAWAGNDLLVAVPLRAVSDLDLKDDLARLSGRRVRFVLAHREEIDARINQVYRAEGELADLTSDLAVDQEEQPDLDSFTEVAGDAPVVRFVNLLISQAISDRASDIHIEPTERDVRVRYRIDGVLQDAHRAPRTIHSGVVSRLKIMAEMDIAERRIPQDGRLTVNHHGKKMDLRIATLPTVWGEKIVARVLDNSNTRLGLGDLGFSPDNFARFSASYSKPYGMILVTGPTGSGKSTTLYATLNILSQPQVNVITVEDPVEYRLPGINQVQTNNKAGLTFASALRSILRSDPDIVLIGEIRDHETANIAVEASLTGHLVLSTLHTNDAPSAVTRLVEMGIEPFLVGSALDAVVAQRLCRSLCERCREAYQPSAAELAALRFDLDPAVDHLYRPVGCTSCAGTGYRGRLALHEVMSVTEEIERLTVARASTDDINQRARAQGMASLREDGWLKVQQGKTSIEEVLRVVG